MRLTHTKYFVSMWRVSFDKRIGLCISLGRHDFALLWSH